MQSYTDFYYQCSKVCSALFPLNHLFNCLNFVLVLESWNNSMWKVTFPNMTIYLRNVWEPILCKTNLSFPWDLSLSDLAALSLTGLVFARMMGFLGVGGSPQACMSQTRNAEVGRGGKGGSIFNGYEHRLPRWASYYTGSLPLTICVILSKLLILLFKILHL